MKNTNKVAIVAVFALLFSGFAFSQTVFSVVKGAGGESKFFDCDQQRRPGSGEHRHRRFISGVDLEPHQRSTEPGAERE